MGQHKPKLTHPRNFEKLSERRDIDFVPSERARSQSRLARQWEFIANDEGVDKRRNSDHCEQKHKRPTRAKDSTESTIIGSSASCAEIRKQIKLYAAHTEPVLITGETGVGKELVAQELHAQSNRSDAPFICVNAAAVHEQLAQSEFFGHVKGAFTGAHETRFGAFAKADGGVIFLDEIGDMPMPLQAQLLRVLDNKKISKVGEQRATPVDFRLIAATNADLARSVEKGGFRKDFFYRLNVLSIHVPPLRERREDILEIANHFIRTRNNIPGRCARLSDKAIDKLSNYDYPGNVRELKNIVDKALILANGDVVKSDHVKLQSGRSSCRAASLNIPEAREKIGHLFAMRALLKTGGNATKAAELTGLTRSTFHNIKKGLNKANYREDAALICAELERVIYEE